MVVHKHNAFFRHCPKPVIGSGIRLNVNLYIVSFDKGQAFPGGQVQQACNFVTVVLLFREPLI